MLPKGCAPRPDFVVAFTTRLDLSPYCASGAPVISCMLWMALGGSLGGEHLALLIVDGLAVDDEADLRMIAQWMEKSVGVACRALRCCC